nr:MAG TPA: hypothetical protein [Caudoviricetes sp.]
MNVLYYFSSGLRKFNNYVRMYYIKHTNKFKQCTPPPLHHTCMSLRL